MNYFRRALRFTSSELCVQIHALSYSLDVKLILYHMGLAHLQSYYALCRKNSTRSLHEALGYGIIWYFRSSLAPHGDFSAKSDGRTFGCACEAITVVILRVTQDPALRCAARDGVILDTHPASHYIVPPITLSNGAGSRLCEGDGGINPAQAPKGDLAVRTRKMMLLIKATTQK